ncbi:MAG: hypothetical protein ACE37D_02135 [Pseudomonadales bacterium]
MTRLILLGGPVGVGKSSAMKLLKQRLRKVALVDADETWNVSDDLAPAPHRGFAHKNIFALVDGYLRAGVETIVVNWVFARPELYQPIIDHCGALVDEVYQLYLVAHPNVIAARITQRWQQDGENGDLDALLDYAQTRLALITDLPFVKIDNSQLSVAETADAIAEWLAAQEQRR